MSTGLEARPAKKRKLSAPLEQDHQDNVAVLKGAFGDHASRWNLEQDYEKRPRKQKKEKQSTKLPIKTAQGRLQQVEEEDEEDEALSDASSFASLATDTPETDVSQPDADDEPKLSSREQIIQAKEELAKIAALFSESPEDHISSLKTLNTISSSRNPTVTKLGLATQLSVYKDIIPGYRIRALSEEDLTSKVSKDVRKQRAFEQGIVRGYHTFLKDLSRLANLDPDKDSGGLASVAVSCAASLLEHVAHFNFRGDLLKIHVDKLAQGPKRSPEVFAKSRGAIEKLFANDDDGNASLEAVTQLSKMIKGKNLRVHEDVLHTFLHLRLLSEFAHKASTSRVDTEDSSQPRQKFSKKEREHRSKKERKAAKERKAIAKEMREADAVVSHEERDANQAETLKLVFGVYFRVLQARPPGLMGATLEGLVRYAHLINQEFFGDLLEALRELIADPARDAPATDDNDHDDHGAPPAPDKTREHLLCIVTAFGLLQGQDAAASASTLGLDLSAFTAHLYRSLHATSLAADIEARAGGTAATGDASRVDAATTIVLLQRALRGALLPANPRAVPPARVAAFLKRLLTCALALPERSAAAVVRLVGEAVRAQGGRVAGLWASDERRGDGVYDAAGADADAANVFATSVFEGELLRLHYSGLVRDGLGVLDRVIADI